MQVIARIQSWHPQWMVLCVYIHVHPNNMKQLSHQSYILWICVASLPLCMLCHFIYKCYCELCLNGQTNCIGCCKSHRQYTNLTFLPFTNIDHSLHLATCNEDTIIKLQAKVKNLEVNSGEIWFSHDTDLTS